MAAAVLAAGRAQPVHRPRTLGWLLEGHAGERARFSAKSCGGSSQTRRNHSHRSAAVVARRHTAGRVCGVQQRPGAAGLLEVVRYAQQSRCLHEGRLSAARGTDISRVHPGRISKVLQPFGVPLHPVGQGASDAAHWARFLDHSSLTGMPEISVWRYGVTNGDVWPLLGERTPSGQLYIVQSGDTLSKIGRALGRRCDAHRRREPPGGPERTVRRARALRAAGLGCGPATACCCLSVYNRTSRINFS